jgi:hypothetical protein
MFRRRYFLKNHNPRAITPTKVWDSIQLTLSIHFFLCTVSLKSLKGLAGVA